VSKAFPSEETPDPGPLIRPAPRLAPGEIRYVTPEGQAELRELLARLRAARDPREQQVAETLAVLTVLGPEGAPDGQVAFGTWVTVRDGEGDLHTWRIVGPDEADPKRGLVSVHAPVGRALLGAGVGDPVIVERPGGRLELEVVSIGRHSP
jgi:transcription elongation factor GreB